MFLLPALTLSAIVQTQTQKPAEPGRVTMEVRIFTAGVPVKVERFSYEARDDDNDTYVGSKADIDQDITKLNGDHTLKQVSIATVHTSLKTTASVKATDSLKEDLVELSVQPEDPVDPTHPHFKIELTWNLKAGKDVVTEKKVNSTVMLGADRELLLVAPFNGSRMVVALTVKPEP